MFYLINKPRWMSSFDVIRKLRKILLIKKLWHTWTLDTLATGCLLIATGKSTKLIPLLEKSYKTYIFELDISRSSPSLDEETPISPWDMTTFIEKTPVELTNFLLSQTHEIPPRYSAIHIDGKRAYELARQGKEISLPCREVHIADVKILTFTPPYFRIEITISAGGYIRSLAPLIAHFFWVADSGLITSIDRSIIHIQNWCKLEKLFAQELDHFDTNKYIDYNILFPDIPNIPIDDIQIIERLKNWMPIAQTMLENTTNTSKNVIGDFVFLESTENLSLCQFDGSEYIVIKNHLKEIS
jgi:tRNA pseudouridine(55) synthase